MLRRTEAIEVEVGTGAELVEVGLGCPQNQPELRAS
jgi:hypothetical protein